MSDYFFEYFRAFMVSGDEYDYDCMKSAMENTLEESEKDVIRNFVAVLITGDMIGNDVIRFRLKQIHALLKTNAYV